MRQTQDASISNMEAEILASSMRRRAQKLEVLQKESIWSRWSYWLAIVIGALLGTWMQRDASGHQANFVVTFGFMGFVMASAMYAQVRELKRKVGVLAQLALEESARQPLLQEPPVSEGRSRPLFSSGLP